MTVMEVYDQNVPFFIYSTLHMRYVKSAYRILRHIGITSCGYFNNPYRYI